MEKKRLVIERSGNPGLVFLVTNCNLKYFIKQKYSKLLKAGVFGNLLFVNHNFLTFLSP